MYLRTGIPQADELIAERGREDAMRLMDAARALARKDVDEDEWEQYTYWYFLVMVPLSVDEEEEFRAATPKERIFTVVWCLCQGFFNLPPNPENN